MSIIKTWQSNEIVLRGYIGTDPKLFEYEKPSAFQMLKFKMAENIIYVGRDGEVTQKVNWHYIRAYNKRAYKVLNNAYKGARVQVTGRQVNHEFKDKETGQLVRLPYVESLDIFFPDAKDDNYGFKKDDREIPWELGTEKVDQ